MFVDMQTECVGPSTRNSAYSHLASRQQALYSDGEGVCGNVRLSLAKFTDFLSTVETCAPQPIAESARDFGFSAQSGTARRPPGVDFSAASSRVSG